VHRRQWRQTLTDYVFPIIGDRPVAEITLDDVRHVLDQPVGERSLWLAHPESASRIRGRIEAILEAAAAQGLRDPNTANPAAWRRLKHFYPAKTKIQPVQHHAALAYAELPALWQKLTVTPGVAARCLRFLILTAARSSEARGATWDEIDLDRATWTIPAARMKAGRPHEVPLSSPALTILEEVPPAQRGGLLFPGKGRLGRPVSDTMLAKLLPPGATVHGMRSAFRSWAADHGVARELAEAALAHVIGSAVERAYQRSNLLERRRDLMHQWSGFVTKLVPLPNDYDTIISMD
jgi:integrase